MTERIDHAAEARTALNGAEGHYWDETPSQVALYLQKAQAEATLALVEQQRVANLIAWTVGSGYGASPEVAAEIVAVLHMPETKGAF